MWWATVLLFLHVKRSKAACKVAKKCLINSAKMHQNAFRFFSQVGTYQDRLASWSKLSWLRFLFDFLQLRRFFDDLRGLLTFARHLLQLSPVDVSLLGSFDVHRSTAAVAQPTNQFASCLCVLLLTHVKVKISPSTPALRLFFTRDVMHSADYAAARCSSVCLSVRLCVIRRYFVATAKYILKTFFHHLVATPF